MHFNKNPILITVAALLLSLLVVGSAAAWTVTAKKNKGIVSSVVRAPVVADGDVAGAPTDIVINLDRSLDPAVAGRTLLKGHKIKITLPEAFVNTGKPVKTIFTNGCTPPVVANLECTSGILLQGWPQHPIFPIFPPAPPFPDDPEFYSVSLEGTHTLVFTALKDVTPGLNLPGPGIKQMHLFTVGFTNPSPGFYDIQVMAQTGPGGAWESGTGRVQILPKARPSINVTSVFNGAGNPNTIYQQAEPNSAPDLPYDFLLWDHGGEPFIGVDLEMVNSKRALMKQGNAVVGHVFIDAPKGAKGQQVSAAEPSFAIIGPVLSKETARLTVNFITGDKAGLYTVTFSLNGGNSTTMYVTVN